MFLKKNSKNLRSILTVLTLFGLGLTGFFWAAGSSAMKTSGSSNAAQARNQISPDALFPGTGVGAIPDSTASGTYGTPLVVSFNVSGVTQNISGVSVDMTLTHTWIGDLDVVLAAPGGSPSIPVFTRVGATTATAVGDSSNLGGTYTFNDSATGDIWATALATTCGTDCVVAPGGYRTSAALTGAPTNLTLTFGSLTPAQANGTWTLTFRDGAAGDTGTVTAANLNILTGGPTPTPPATPTPTPTPVPGALQDGGFEQNTGSTVITNPFWTSTSTAFTTSLCTSAACGNGGGTAGPRTGNGWVWFDGASDTATAAEQGTVSQSAIIPVGTTTLNYYLRIGRTNAPNASTLTVSVDGTVLQTINEPSAPETAYTLRTVDISGYANGASHTILFTYNRPGANGDSFTIDDVSLVVGGATPTPTVTPTPTSPTPTPTPTSPTPTPSPAGTSTAGYGILALTTTNQLIRFNSNTANSLDGESLVMVGTPVTITGLASGENILGIDFRPATGQLYGLSSASRLYTINTVTGAATNVGTAGSFTLSGTNFGFDFNPTVDRIRVISDTGQNLRLNPNDGTITATDPNLNGATTGADAAAYTNSFANSTATTLYDISSTTDTLYTQNPANAGTLVTVGALGINITGVNGFDIANSGNLALGAFQIQGATSSGLYRVNLTTGAATLISPINSPNPIRGLAITFGSPATNTLDFNGDGRSDFVVSRPTGGNNGVYFSTPNGANYASFGLTSDTFAPGDYDGDGRTDLAVWRSSNGTFYVLQSSTNTTVAVQFGQNGDKPVARDYDGDGRTDFAVVRPANGVLTWYYRSSLFGTTNGIQFGAATDTIAPGDYDGDGKFDFAVYRGTTGQAATFYVQRSSTGFASTQFGLGGDRVVPGDYDGDGKTDYAVLRSTSSGYGWYILRSSDNAFFGVTFGTSPHLPVQNDYDGDGKTDVAVWVPANGNFYYLQSSNGVTGQVPFGQNGDYPVANYNNY